MCTSTFAAYTKKYRESMIDINNSYPPSRVVSIDHTFNVNKRTVQMTTGPPPEKRSSNEPNNIKFDSIKENAVLMTIGANGLTAKDNCRSISRGDRFSRLKAFDKSVGGKVI